MRCAALPPAQLPGSNCRRPEPLRICPKAPRAGNRKAGACEGGGIRPRGRTSVQNERVPVAISALSSAWLGIVAALSPLQLSGLTCRRPGVWPAYAHLSKSVQSGGWKAGVCEGGSIRLARPGKPIVQEGWRAVAMRPPLGMVRYRGGLAVPAAVGPDRHMAGACTSVRKRLAWRLESRRLRGRRHSPAWATIAQKEGVPVAIPALSSRQEPGIAGAVIPRRGR